MYGCQPFLRPKKARPPIHRRPISDRYRIRAGGEPMAHRGPLVHAFAAGAIFLGTAACTGPVADGQPGAEESPAAGGPGDLPGSPGKGGAAGTGGGGGSTSQPPAADSPAWPVRYDG